MAWLMAFRFSGRFRVRVAILILDSAEDLVSHRGLLYTQMTEGMCHVEATFARITPESRGVVQPGLHTDHTAVL